MQRRFLRKQTSRRVDEHVLEGQKVAEQRSQPNLFSTAHCFCHSGKTMDVTT